MIIIFAGEGSDDENLNEKDDDTESVYCRLEESRLQLEEELGCEDFLKAYKTVQVGDFIEVQKEKYKESKKKNTSELNGV